MLNKTAFSSIGKRQPRSEDYRLLTGRGRYIDDIDISGALHACFVRSPYAHARILSIDGADAEDLPGVVGVFTGNDLSQWTTKLRMAPPIEGVKPLEMTTLPIDKVLFHGDLVACIVAEDRYLAEDAMELVDIDYEPLPPITDMFKALEDDSFLIDETLGTNLISQQSFATPDVHRIMSNGDKVIESTFSEHRQTHLPIETRGIIAQWDAGCEHLTVHVGNQATHPYRSALAARLRISESQLTVISPDVGGGFGQKIALYREELTVAALARYLNQPVRWREDRMENLMAASHAREDWVRTRTVVEADGRLKAMSLEIVEDFGGYCFYPANYLARVIAMILSGPYKLQHYAYDVKVVLTNKCGNGPMRAPMAITSWIMDGTIDNIARELGMDPVEVRRINMIREDEFPYQMATGETLEDINPFETMEKGLALIGYEKLRKQQKADQEQGIYRGIGICNVVESTTYGSKFYKSAGIPGSGHEAAWVRVEPSGAIIASVGISATGQGYETAFAQTVAEGLGVNAEDVSVQLGNTDVAPYGMGSRGARGGTAGGGTAYLAGQDAQKKVLAIAAKMLGLNTDEQLSMKGGKVWRRLDEDWSDTKLTLADVARIAYLDPTNLPQGMEPGIQIHKTYDPPSMTYSNSTHFCQVVVDVKTGAVCIERYLIVENCGTVINPLIVEGQQHGATIMGLSGTLFEQVIYDENGQNLTGSLADYLIPTATEVPDLEIVHMNTANKRTPAGIKGMAEGGVMGAIGALSNSVSDALLPFGIVIDKHPISPNVLRTLLREKE